MVIPLAGLLLSLVSVAVTAVLIGVLGIQQVYGHIRAVKRLFIEALIAFIGIDMIWLVRRVLPLDEAAAIIAMRLLYSLVLFSAGVMGYAATVIYRKPGASMWKDIYRSTIGGGKMFIPFISFISILVSSFILGWAIPVRGELSGCPTPYTPIYVPILETQHLIIFSISLIAFLAYPAAVFLLASYAAENRMISRDLRMFALCVIGIGISIFLQAFLLAMCFAETVDVIRIFCFIGLTYVFRRITALQSLQYVELSEYLEQLRRGRIR